ncbi:basic phospholipase A2 4-like [Cetorhinus maximus]
MEHLKFIAVLLGLGAMLNPAQGAATQARGLLQFAAVVQCANPSFQNLAYLDYGCFCGFGSNGNQPVDRLDRCCQVHDNCYGRADRMGCNSYFAFYRVICRNWNPSCSIRSFGQSSCGLKVCRCDVKAARCFKKYRNRFNPKFVNYNQSRCFRKLQ